MNDPRANTRGEALLVVCLCAAWCYVCTDFRPMFAELARAHPQARFAWVDIEDEAALVGEVDIENFPTLAVFRGSVPLYFGVAEPKAPVIARTLGALFGAAPRAVAVPEQIAALPRELAAR